MTKKKEEVDIEEEVQRLSRKTNINVMKLEYSFSKQLERLDNEIDNVLNEKIKEFNDSRKVSEEFLPIEFHHDTIDRYREKLRKI